MWMGLYDWVAGCRVRGPSLELPQAEPAASLEIQTAKRMIGAKISHVA